MAEKITKGRGPPKEENPVAVLVGLLNLGYDELD